MGTAFTRMLDRCRILKPVSYVHDVIKYRVDATLLREPLSHYRHS